MTAHPVPVEIEGRILETLGGWLDRIEEYMSAEWSRRIIEHDIYGRLHSGAASMAAAMEAVKQGDPVVYAALKKYAVEVLDDPTRDEELKAQLRAFIISALEYPAELSYPQGHGGIDTISRDVAVAVLVNKTMLQWSLTDTKAAAYVSKALRRRGIKRLGQPTVLKIYRTHQKLAQKLASEIRV